MGMRIKKCIAAEPARPAIVPVGPIVCLVNPRQRDLHAGLSVRPNALRFKKRWASGTEPFWMQIRLQIRNHIDGGRTNPTRPGQRIEIPTVNRVMLRVIPLNESTLLLGGKRNGRVAHPQRPRNRLAEQIGITHAGAVCQHLPQQAETKIAVTEKESPAGLATP